MKSRYHPNIKLNWEEVLRIREKESYLRRRVLEIEERNILKSLYWVIIIDLREIVKYSELNYFVTGEAKIDESFPSQQFVINNFQIRARKDEDCHGDELIEFVRNSFICKRLTYQKPKKLECTCSELTISSKKWMYLSIYRPINSQNIDCFFNDCSDSFSKN